jgi:TRAP-type C4-dicarboxylate transport system substrate-binding protein
VAELSSGEVHVRVANDWTLPAERREETKAVIDVAHSRADLGWAGTRTFGCLGVRSLDPLQAPLLLADYASVDAACRDGIAREMLEPLDRLELVGLSVLPGALRKPFAFARQLLDPGDYAGTRFRIHESVVAEATCRALGATPVLLSKSELVARPEAKVDGMELHAEAIASWGYSGSVAYNVNLWPRTIALVVSRRTFLWLGASEQALLFKAAEQTLERGLAHLAGQERLDREALSGRADLNVVHATEGQLAALRERLEPVYEDLRRHPETGRGLQRLEALVDSVSRDVVVGED